MSNSTQPTTNRKMYKVKEGMPFLWPHIAVGLAKHTFDKDKWSVTPVDGWLLDEVTRKSRVAIIDNGLCQKHPNLPADAITCRADFSHHRGGSRYPFSEGQDASEDKDDGEDADKKQMEALLASIEDDGNHKFVQCLVNEARGWASKTVAGVPDPCHRFSAHGTACAGLIAGRFFEDDAKKNPWAINYVGMNPYADIIPINTPYNYEYWPITNGLLWAWLKGADVILIPRGVHDLPDLAELELDYGMDHADRHPRFTRLADKDSEDYKRLARDKNIFEALLAVVSTIVPVVVSAGNDGTKELQYPAKLVTGKAPDLIVVGACTARGVKSTYSNGDDRQARNGVTVFAPSDDQGEISESLLRYDERDWRGRQLTLDVHKENPADRDNEYAPFGVLAIDIPGTWGYSALFDEDLEFNDEGQSKDLLYEQQHSPGALYTIFGGTSAASAIVAGLISTHQMRQTSPKTGREMKAYLMDVASKPGEDLLDPDPNEYGPIKSDLVQGMINAARLI